MGRVSKKNLLGVAVFVGLSSFAIYCWFYADRVSYQSTRNPCERACLQDSGGLLGCRKECASHPLTFGPASQPPGH